MKWLGDGVMVYFGDPGSGVVAALELIDGVVRWAAARSCWAARRTVLFQQGDYYGRTVNLASRIAEYRPAG